MADKARVITRKHAIYSLVILFFVNIMNNLDRYLIGIVFPLIKTDLSLSDTELGIIGGVAFTVFYAIMAFPMGWAVDRFTRKYVISVGLAVWSAATFLSGLAHRLTHPLVLFFSGRHFLPRLQKSPNRKTTLHPRQPAQWIDLPAPPALTRC